MSICSRTRDSLTNMRNFGYFNQTELRPTVYTRRTLWAICWTFKSSKDNLLSSGLLFHHTLVIHMDKSYTPPPILTPTNRLVIVIILAELMPYIHKDKKMYYICDDLSLTIPCFSERFHLIYLSKLIKNTTKVDILLHLYVELSTQMDF